MEACFVRRCFRIFKLWGIGQESFNRFVFCSSHCPELHTKSFTVTERAAQSRKWFERSDENQLLPSTRVSIELAINDLIRSGITYCDASAFN